MTRTAAAVAGDGAAGGPRARVQASKAQPSRLGRSRLWRVLAGVTLLVACTAWNPASAGAAAAVGAAPLVTVNPDAAAATATYTITFTAGTAPAGKPLTIRLDADAGAAGTVFPSLTRDYTVEDVSRAKVGGPVSAAPVVSKDHGVVTLQSPVPVRPGDTVALVVTGVSNPSRSAAADTMTVQAPSGEAPARSAPYAITRTPVSIGPVSGAFYAHPAGNGTFDPTQLATPAFSEKFPLIDFNPPLAVQGACANAAGISVNESTRPFTDVNTGSAGGCAAEVARGNGLRAGVSSLFQFEAALTSTLYVAVAGEVTFDVYADDGWMLGLGPAKSGRAPRFVRGVRVHVPTPARTAQRGYPVMGAYNVATSAVLKTFTVNFPAPGAYPLEMDYTECCGGTLSLMFGSAFGAPVPPAVAATTRRRAPRPVRVGATLCRPDTVSAYARAVLADHPVAYYRLDEKGGAVLCDASGHGDNGTYAAGGVALGAAGATRDGGRAIIADGVADPATAAMPTVGGASGASASTAASGSGAAKSGGSSTPNAQPAPLAGNVDLTLEGWYRGTAQQDEVLVSVGQPGLRRMIGLGVWNADDVVVDADEGYYVVHAAHARIQLRDGRWHFLAATYTAATHTLRFYADGRSLGRVQMAGPMDLVPGPLRIGWWADTAYNQPLRGSLDEVALYDTALSGAQIRAQYAAAAVPGADQSTIAAALVPPGVAFGSVSHDVQAMAVSAAGVMLIAFPAELFNSTLEENYEEIREKVRRRLGRFAGVLRWLGTAASGQRWGIIVVIVIGALLGSMLDPRFGWGWNSLEAYLGMLASILVGLAVSVIVAFRYRRWRGRRHQYAFQAIPAGLVVAAFCVLISRLASFEPGYLYGIICGVVFAEELVAHEEAHIVALSAIANLVAVGLFWLLWVLVNPPSTAAGADFPLVIFDDFLGAAVTLGLTGTVFGLLPLRFLPGGRLASWHRGAWTVTFLAAVFGLVSIVVWPHRLVPSSGAPLVTVIVLFLAFGAGSLWFWWYFRHREPGGSEPPAGGAATGHAGDSGGPEEAGGVVGPDPAGPAGPAAEPRAGA